MENNELKLKLTAGILNLGNEVEIYDWLALIAGDYGIKPFNKRFETWLNKQSAERFGTYIVKQWGFDKKDKEFENVRFGFHKQSWGDHMELNIYYNGKEVGYDYDAKKAVMRDSNERETLVSVKSIDQIIDYAKKSSTNRAIEREKLRGNLTVLPELVALKENLTKMIRSYNDDISYIISDEMRIKL